MNKLIIITITIFTQLTFSQSKMKKVQELIDFNDSSWPGIKEWAKSSKNKVEILTANEKEAGDALYKTQVSTRSTLGAIIYMSGGILIDDGWIRILGAGNKKLKRTLPDWNQGKTFNKFGEQPPFLLIADDAIGGFFMLNGGGLGNDLGGVYYFAPDSLEFEPLNLNYTQFINFCFNGNLAEFYKNYRWKNWKEDVSKLDCDKVFNFYPYLWSKEGKDIENLLKEEVPIEEQYILNIDFRKQLGIDK
jgi:hypothetical protein